MKKGLIITMIICVILFCLGVGLVIAGWQMGAATDFDIDLVNRKIRAVSEESLVSGEVETGAFSDINIDMDASNVNIIEGNSFKVDYRVYYEAPEIKNDDGKLVVKEKNNSKKLRFHLNAISNEETYVNIYIPKGTIVNSCNIKIDAGNVDVKSQNMGNFKVDADAGDIKLDSSSFSAININGDAGNMIFSDIKADSVEGDVNYGNVKINDSEIGDFTLDTDAGNTIVKSTKMNNVDITADAGNVKLELIGEKFDYSIEAKVDYGSLTLDGAKQAKNIDIQGKSGKKIKIDADAGNVDIDF